jgi:hypothetical protein
LLAAGAAITCGDRARAEDPRATAFLDRLVGPWTGRAETTPAGPRPYDMTFVRTPDSCIKATAEPGNSTHHWTFLAADGRLQLVFLTTFAGNRDPQHFFPATFVGEEARFATERTDGLEVRVRPTAERLEIDVLRRGRLHVAIRLVKR